MIPLPYRIFKRAVYSPLKGAGVPERAFPNTTMTDSDYPWRDESLLYELYWEQELTTTEIANKLGCMQQTVSKWMQRLDIPRRDPREAAPNRRRHPAVFTDRGYVICASNYRGTTDSVGIHRLVMVAERGFEDVVEDKHSTTVNQITA